MKNNTQPSALHLAREQLIRILNQDLASDCHAMMAFIVYSQVLKRAACPVTAQALERHASEDYQHAISLAEQIVHLGGQPCLRPNLEEMSHLMLSA